MTSVQENSGCWPCWDLRKFCRGLHVDDTSLLNIKVHPSSANHSATTESFKLSCKRSANWFIAKGNALASRPWWLLIVFLFTCTAMGLGLWAVIAAANSESESRKTMAWTSAEEKARNVQAVVEGVLNPVFTLAMIVKLNPFNWTAVDHAFHSISEDVYNQTNSEAIYNLELAPNAIIKSIIPEAGFLVALNSDTLRPERYVKSMQTITSNKVLLMGPMLLTAGVIGLVARYPVFIPGVDLNETFGFGPYPIGTAADGRPIFPTTPPACCSTKCSSLVPGNTTPCCSTPTCAECTPAAIATISRWNACSPLDPPPGMGIYDPNRGNCSISACYHQSMRAKFWGFTQAIVGWEETKAIARLYDLCNQFDFVLKTTGRTPIAMCSDIRMIPTATPGIFNGTLGTDTIVFNEDDPVSVNITAMSSHWTLWVVDRRGWTPNWKAPLIVMVVIISLLLSMLVVLLMASHLQQGTLLKEQKASNRKLEQTTAVLAAEKATTEALIIRQLNLISCFASAGFPDNKSHDGSSMAGTLSRIEAVRIQLSSGQRESNPVKVTNLLGEGSFGKVYKGVWRGTEVAVKTIVLPSNMSGAAKREKMAIMEAAISSSLAHPNVVQTYTYSIRPVRDNTGYTESQQMPSSLIQTQPIGTMTQHAPQDSWRQPDKEGQIISYEVSLVIEYCDRGCLRDALDAGVFFSPSGLNYKAILDTACDIAKAMVHLHMANVLHSDLKARNVMLKSSGQEGRGVCAKVADFGLSISLDSTQTHASSMFQGTMTHMAPEVLMKGHVSKAADVYAFGITLWELLTAASAFTDVPVPHLGHAITALKKRPKFSMFAPCAYVKLTEACWAHEPEDRPSFVSVLQALQDMRAALSGPTQPLQQPSVPSTEAKADKGSGTVNVCKDVFLENPLAARRIHNDTLLGSSCAAPAKLSAGTGCDAKAVARHGSAGPRSMKSNAIFVGDGEHSYPASLDWVRTAHGAGLGVSGSMYSCLRHSALADVPEGRESSKVAREDLGRQSERGAKSQL